jgi:hypothetical protein
MVNTTVFLRLLDADDKAAALARAVDALGAGQRSDEVYALNPGSFAQVPGSPFAYWAGQDILALFVKMPSVESHGREVRVGGQTSDDFRFLRLFWETSLTTARCWRPFQKGGDFARYYSDILLVADWDANRETFRGFYGRIGRANIHPSSYRYFFRRGLTWSRRSQRGLSVRALPSECLFADKGPCIFAGEHELLPLLSVTNTTAFHSLVLLQMAFGSYEVGVIQKTPLPALSAEASAELGRLARECYDETAAPFRADETSHLFVAPTVIRHQEATLSLCADRLRATIVSKKNRIALLQEQADMLATREYGITDRFSSALRESRVHRDLETDDDTDEEISESGPMNSLIVTQSQVVQEMVSYSLGVVVGRWDIRFATGEKPPPELPDPFDPLPVCSPGMLQGDDGLPLPKTPEGYPLKIDWDGILVDDADHPDDIVRRVREVLEVIWKDRAEAIEQEACDILGFKELRDYFRKPAKGGFWDDHVSRYSKSRRKAPIYWLLQSSKKNYALWLYYHRLDKDLLFKALVNYVEPKIRLETSRLEALRGQKAAAGESGQPAKRLAKEVERQEDFISELREFEDKLRRAANLQLDPDLNDGVVLNIAPLYELVPWKEAKKYWTELLEGKYEWSSIGKQLREKGMVK